MSTTACAPATRDARSPLVTTEFEAVTRTVLRANPGMEDGLAQRIVTEALKFVATATAAARPRSGPGLAPSRVVDEGWHALILHTHTYARLCRSLGGRFVHYVPQPPDPTRAPGILSRTVAAIEAAGFTVDVDLWIPAEDRTFVVAADCQHSETNCTDCNCSEVSCQSGDNQPNRPLRCWHKRATVGRRRGVQVREGTRPGEEPGREASASSARVPWPWLHRHGDADRARDGAVRLLRQRQRQRVAVLIPGVRRCRTQRTPGRQGPVSPCHSFRSDVPPHQIST
ncbi:hypothetical protein ACIO3O_05250 [Streptomyces sp. NPDC087440]|uniref:hypothetical protein n=1 Tax=Streptomyces sp. NPDC087440 TaxID=3365790 RepID=UPI003814AEB2